MTEAEVPARLPGPFVTQVFPTKGETQIAQDLINDWFDSNSRLLIVSGAPGAGKTTFLEDLYKHASAKPLQTRDNFPAPTESLTDLSKSIASIVRTHGESTRIVVATQISATDARAGIVTHISQDFSHFNPWVITIEAIPLRELTSLHESQPEETRWLKPVFRLESRGYDTRFLRTPAALALLRSPDTQVDQHLRSISDLLNNYIERRLFLCEFDRLSPSQHKKVLSTACADFALGRGITDEDSTSTSRRRTIAWLEGRITSDGDMGVTAREIAMGSPFLRVSAGAREIDEVFLPSSLEYEYFVAEGLAERLNAGETLGLNRSALRDLTAGIIVVLMQRRMLADTYTLLISHCRSAELGEHDRLFFLYLLEDSSIFASLLRESPEEYIRWLEEFVKTEAPNTHCWKIAGFQLLILGKLELSTFIEEIGKESPAETSLEWSIQAERSGGDIDKQLITRIQNGELHNCRGVTAVRMGDFGSLACVLPLARAIAHRRNTEYETQLFLDGLGKIILRGKK